MVGAVSDAPSGGDAAVCANGAVQCVRSAGVYRMFNVSLVFHEGAEREYVLYSGIRALM